MTLRSLLPRPASHPAPAPGGSALFDRLDTWPRQGLVLLLLATALRISTFGDPNLFIDEAFYFSVGQAMHDGSIPYVDIWDRKPLGLFIIYWAIAGISRNVIAYQIAATVFAAATALVIVRFCSAWATRFGAILAGAAYLLFLNPLLGFGGQSPVFYNLLVAVAAYCVFLADAGYLQNRVTPQTWLAMLLCGLAITCKQTAIAESCFLGLWVLARLRRGGATFPRLSLLGAGFALLGALPMVLIATWYWLNGYWAPFWHAMFTSNLVRHPIEWSAVPNNPFVLVQDIGMLFAVVGLGFVWAGQNPRFRSCLPFVGGWLAASVAGFAMVPRIIDHYAIPVLTPACLVCSAVFILRFDRVVLFGAMCLPPLALSKPWDFMQHRLSRESTEAIARFIREHPGNGSVLVYDGPPLLYAMSGLRRLTALQFPDHLNDSFEKDTSLLRTGDELRRIIAQQPGAVVTAAQFRPSPDPGALAELQAYLKESCKVALPINMYQPFGFRRALVIYGDCGRREDR